MRRETRSDNTIDDTAKTATKGKVGPSFYGSQWFAVLINTLAEGQVWHTDAYP